MQPDPDWLRELAQRARGVAGIVPSADGTDATGCVRVTLGPDGVPVRIAISAGWARRLAAGQLAAAVLQANAGAVHEAVRGWAQRQEQGQDPPVGAPALPQGDVREGSDLAEEALTVLQDARRRLNQTARPDVGTDGRHVTVQLGAGGLTGCTIDPGWAASRDGHTISAALGQALTAAKRATREHGDSLGTGIDALIGDALATLRSMTDPPTTQGGER